ncbi:MAG: DUF2207 domain-containing protein [Anaerolineaceae bacterium]|nr:DUF2207 domain-containing protein [Anaerolineaceae bacterium]
MDEQVRKERSVKSLPYSISGGLGSFIALMIALMLLQRSKSDQDDTRLPPTDAKPVNPPTDYKPAVAAALVAGNTPSMTHTLATLIDLAQKGAVSIEQLPGKWYSSHRFELVRLPYSSLLDKHEQVLMDALFSKRGQPVERIELSQYSRVLGKSWSTFSKTIQAEITALGLINPERKKTQSRVMIIGGVLILIGILFVITLAIAMNSISSDLSLNINQATGALLGVSISAWIAGFIYVIAGALYSTLSSRGRWIADQWSGFSKYLKDIIAQREQALRPDTFTQFLPFAAGFGLGSQWAKSFQKRGFTDTPAWCHALNALDAESSYGALVTFMTSSNSEASSGGAGGGGGGASGGGGSGAG